MALVAGARCSFRRRREATSSSVPPTSGWCRPRAGCSGDRRDELEHCRLEVRAMGADAAEPLAELRVPCPSLLGFAALPLAEARVLVRPLTCTSRNAPAPGSSAAHPTNCFHSSTNSVSSPGFTVHEPLVKVSAMGSRLIDCHRDASARRSRSTHDSRTYTALCHTVRGPKAAPWCPQPKEGYR